MPKLNQIVALTQGRKSRNATTITAIYHKAQKAALFSGLVRTYQPKDDDGETQPSESHKVQEVAADLIESFQDSMQDLFDIVATQDRANCFARADVTVDGEVLIKDVPATTLLFLEKQMADVKTFIEHLPTLDPTEDWDYNKEQGLWASKPQQTSRSKKVPRAFVKAPATDKHPAQVDVFTEDVQVGTWTKISYSGAIPSSQKSAMLTRVAKLLDAVKSAREQANLVDATDVLIGESLLDYVFEPALEF
jgi:hypothetical protein